MKCILCLSLLVFSALPVSGTDLAYNTGGALGFTPDLFGSSTGWGQWFVTTVYNDTGNDLHLTEFGFPCCGYATGTYGWVVWTDVGSISAPIDGPTSCNYYGAFTPTEPEGGDPTVYTYLDVTSEYILIPDGAYFCFGYQNTQYGGQTTSNGTETWAWDAGVCYSDSQYNRTAILQVEGIEAGALSTTTWGGIKNALGGV